MLRRSDESHRDLRAVLNTSISIYSHEQDRHVVTRAHTSSPHRDHSVARSSGHDNARASVSALAGHTGDVNDIHFDRDGGRFVSASSDHTVRLWETATGQCLRVFEGHTDEVFAAVFHPDNKRIASAGRDRAVWLWDTASGQEVARLPGHTSYIWSLAFSPDGQTLVSGSGDSTVRLWDTAPLKARYQARREAAVLRPEADRLVERLFAEKANAAVVAAAVAADVSLSEPQKKAAFRALLRRSALRRDEGPGRLMDAAPNR